jgi:hypothetical protein
MKNNDIKKEIVKVFQSSNSSDELFDTFRVAISKKINDVDLYTILLWNKVLSPDEIAMYAGKICKEFPEHSYKIYMAAADILESTSLYGKNKDAAFDYIKKAAQADKRSSDPYIVISDMYNYELDIPKFEKIADFIIEGLRFVKEKSVLCFALSKLYAKKGEIEKGKYYQKRGEEYQQKENF